jgi:hypothetical protein
LRLLWLLLLLTSLRSRLLPTRCLAPLMLPLLCGLGSRAAIPSGGRLRSAQLLLLAPLPALLLLLWCQRLLLGLRLALALLP